jgi:formamidopyrimidine-DNA glycosylase
MPEGDTIHHAANRIREALVGSEILEIAAPHPRHAADRWPERLRGHAVRRVDAHGKHLFVADDFSEGDYLRRLREDDPARGIGEAVLDQRIVAGIGNIWKCEACFLAGVDPWRKAGDLSDDEALAIVREARPRMRESAVKGGRITTAPGGRWAVWVHERAGLPCRHCGTPIRARGQGDDNRTTFWCPRCQA